MNKEDKAKLHTRLKLIKKYLATNPSMLFHSVGICYNVMYIKKPYFMVCIRDLFAKYPNCSVRPSGTRNLVFPVDGDIKYLHEKKYESIWSNPKRIALLDWLIEETKP